MPPLFFAKKNKRNQNLKAVLDRFYKIKTTGLNNFIIFENCNHNLLNDIIITLSVTLPIR